jgi:hypothetical protein
MVMHCKVKSTTKQVNVLQQIWKRLKIAEWQIIDKIADATELPFDEADMLLHQYPNLPDFLEAIRRRGSFDREALKQSDLDLTDQILLLTQDSIAWGDMDENPVSEVLELL